MEAHGPAEGSDREVSLGPRHLRELFPFFLALDADLRIVQFGPAAPKVLPNLREGAALADVVRVFRPRVKPSFEAFLKESASTFLLDAAGSGIRMRGQMLHDDRTGLLLFLGTPWFTEMEQLEKTGLELKDFTVHDPIIDFLYMVQAKTLALEDAKRFSATIAKQRDELQAANLRLTQALAVKDQFLANTSHELRTPLNGIIGMASLLARTDLGPKQKGYADIVLKSANALLTIVNDILDFSKMEAGKLALEPADFDLRRFAYDVAEVFAVSAQAKGLELVCAVDDDVPRAVRGDPTRLRQILSNLVGNAVKFTGKGEIVIRVGVAESSASDALLRFSVTDTGIGIADADRGRLFEAFSQVDATMSRRYGGTGLGLAISKELSRLMGGQIGLDSEPGVGSTFWFTVRLGRVPAGSDPPAARELGEVRALVVDDNATNRGYVLELLSHWGVVAEGVASAPQALDLLRASLAAGRPYDVLVLDAQMPSMTGVDLALILRSDARFDRLRVVLMSTVDQDHAKASGAGLRIDAFLTKPVRPSYLFDALASLLNGRFLHGERRGATSSPPPAAAPPARGNEARVLIVDDNPVNLEVASRMLEVHGYPFDLAENGRQALDALARFRYAAVLMDLQMPILDGYEATAEIRQREGAQQRTPIIAMTAHAMESDRRRALDLGMDDYISKPIDFDALGVVLERWVPAAPKAAGAEAEPRRKQQCAAPNPEVIDPKALDELRRYQKPGEPDLAASIAEKFLADLEGRARAARMAADLRDLDALARVGHALKSSSAVVGAHRLVSASVELEELRTSADPDRVEVVVRRFEAECDRARAALLALLGRGLPPPSGSRPKSVTPRPPVEADAFLVELQEELNQHPALRHPFLVRFSKPGLTRERLEAFACQHYMYSRLFTRNLAAVIANVPDEDVRNILILNMYEEIGEPLQLRDRAHHVLLEAEIITPEQIAEAYADLTRAGSTRPDVTQVLVQKGLVTNAQVQALVERSTQRARDLTHTALFRRFLRALGLTPAQIDDIEPTPETSRLIGEYEALCRQGHWLEAMGAMGPGTECVVPTMYYYIHQGIQQSGLLEPPDYAFWTLHIGCDEAHGRNILDALSRHATTRENRKRIAAGARRILDARRYFFDGLHRLVFEQIGD